MTMTDPIADLLTRIRNGLAAHKRWVDVPSSMMKKRITFILKEEHYIKDFILLRDGVRETIRIFLKYDYRDKPVITGLKRVSRPGLRVYVSLKDMPRVMDGLGIAILSTSRGVMSNKTAKQVGVGGEVICSVW